MAPGSKLLHQSLANFADRLAARTPTPGGGSVAAFLAGTGASLVAMAFRFTSGEKHATVEEAMTHRAEELASLCKRGLDLVDRDCEAYDEVTAAYRLPKSDDAERAVRSETIQRGLRGALEVPLETMRIARAALDLASAGAAAINPNLASDCATGCWCLSSAAESAALNVRINAASLKDRAYAEERLAECDRLLRECRSVAEAARTAAVRHLA
jgi:formiminotetrahydrofolate cyclodeaminase